MYIYALSIHLSLHFICLLACSCHSSFAMSEDILLELVLPFHHFGSHRLNSGGQTGQQQPLPDKPSFQALLFLLNYFICLHSKCCPPSQCPLPEFFTIHFGSERVLPPPPTALLFQRHCSHTQTLCYLCFFVTLFPAQVDTKFQQFLISRNDFVE